MRESEIKRVEGRVGGGWKGWGVGGEKSGREGGGEGQNREKEKGERVEGEGGRLPVKSCATRD